MQRLGASRKGTQYSPLILEVPGTESNSSQELSRDQHPAVKNWPSGPKTLQEARTLWFMKLSPHLALLLVSIGSVGLGIAVFRTDGTVESAFGNSIMQAMAVTATLWPILFAAVLGPTLRAAALNHAERGVKLGILELLFTSQTLVSALRSCFELRIVSAWPVILVIIWSLSPVGGQGALRTLSLRQNVISYEYPVTSYPHKNLSAFEGGPFNSGASGGASLINRFRAPIGAVFSTQDIALLHSDNASQGFDSTVERLGGMQQSTKIIQRDLWRNVRIPFLHTLEGYDPQATEWLTVPEGTIPGYSSLIGVPVRGFPSMRSGNTSFVIETSYQVLDCKAWLNATDWTARNNGSLIKAVDDEYIRSTNLGIPNISLDIMNDPDRDFRPGQAVSDGSWPKTSMKLVFQFRLNLTICDVRTEYVESAIQCARDSQYGDLACHAKKVRRIALAPELRQHENLTALDIGRNVVVVKYIPYTVASNHPAEPSFLEKWLRNPPTSFYDWEYGMNTSFFDEVPLNILSIRLSTVLNTYLRATMNTTNIYGSDGTSIKSRDETWSNTTGIWTEFTAPVYQINRTWLFIYMVSAFVITISALLNIIFRILTHTPDILTSVSALTRDSMFIQVPSPGSTMDGSERARLLQKKWIMIQDVWPDKRVGRIALSDAEGAIPLRKDRLYV